MCGGAVSVAPVLQPCDSLAPTNVRAFKQLQAVVALQIFVAMPKHTKKSGKRPKGSDDEFAIDLVDSSIPKAPRHSITIHDSDDDVAGPAQTTVRPVTTAEQEGQFPCEWCHQQLVREVDAKKQSRTFSAKTTEILNLLPYFTADELVDTIVDALAVPSSGQANVMSPTSTKVHIADDDANWQTLKFPDIAFFSGTSLEKLVETWWIPKVPVLYNTVTGIPGCVNCKLQSVTSNAGVSAIIE